MKCGICEEEFTVGEVEKMIENWKTAAENWRTMLAWIATHPDRIKK